MTLEEMKVNDQDSLWKDEDVMRSLYVDCNMSQSEVADELGCSPKTVERWLRRHDIGKECPICGDSFIYLGSHWQSSSCETPQISDKQHEIVQGLLMGDGSLARFHDKNSLVKVIMITPEYLNYLDDIFGCLSSGVSLAMTAEEAAKENRDRGFSVDAKKENYSDKYVWRTRSHGGFDRYKQWYSTGNKIWPEDIEMTSTVLKHWYCGDGSLLRRSANHLRIQISMANEIENQEKIDNMFNSSGLPEPKWSEMKRSDGSWDCTGRWDGSDALTLLEYMGEPIPGFEYKWPSEMGGTA